MQPSRDVQETVWPEVTIMRERGLPLPHRPSEPWVWWEIGSYDNDRYEVCRYVPASSVQELRRELEAETARRKGAEQACAEVRRIAEGMQHFEAEAQASNQRRIERDDLAAKLAEVRAEVERLRKLQRDCEAAAGSFPEPRRGVALIHAREAELMADRLQDILDSTQPEQEEVGSGAGTGGDRHGGSLCRNAEVSSSTSAPPAPASLRAISTPPDEDRGEGQPEPPGNSGGVEGGLPPEHEEIAAREVLEAERRTRADLRESLNRELKRREDEEEGLADEAEDQGIPAGERLAFTRALVMEVFDRAASTQPPSPQADEDLGEEVD